MAKRLPKTETAALFSLRREWRRTRRFCPRGFRARTHGDGPKQHWAWGPACHRGAKCPACRNPLTLVWDVSLEDQVFPALVAEAFQPLSRLPIYFCFPCGSAAYLPVSDTAIKAFPPPGEDESPYEEFSPDLLRRAISFEPLPSDIDGLLTLFDCVGFREIDQPAIKRLGKFFRRRIKSESDLNVSQFGGQPLFYQGHSNFVCPNPSCPANKLQYPFGDFQIDLVMKELAVITRDAADEFAATYTQIACHACPICAAIRADYRCT